MPDSLLLRRFQASDRWLSVLDIGRGYPLVRLISYAYASALARMGCEAPNELAIIKVQ